MTKETLYLILGLITIVFIVIAVKGFLILGNTQTEPIPVATTSTTATSTLPDNLSISDEFGG